MSDDLQPQLSIQGGHLYIEGCDTTKLASKFGTPLFVVSEAQLVSNARSFRNSFEACWPEGPVKIMAAVKACPVTAVRRVLTREGIGCDTFGFGELECALRGGVAPENIAVNGSIKGRDIIRKSIDLGCFIVLDSPVELTYCQEEAKALGKKAMAVIRVKPRLDDLDDPSDFFPARTIRELTQTVKYGIPNSELTDMLPRFKECPNVIPMGVHMHVGRHTKKLEAWAYMMKRYAKWIKRVSDGLGDDWTPKVVSIGGGFAAEHDVESRVAVTDYQTPTIEQFAVATTTAFREGMREQGFSTDGMIFEVEPGRALHNETGIHLASVHNIKHETENTDYQWIETDTSECFLSIGGLNTTPPFPYMVASKADAPLTQKADIVGLTCNYECLMEQGDVPAEVKSGDILAFMNTGSYIEVYTCNFNCLPRPGMVLVSGNMAELIKEHETLEQVFSRDVVPQRLKDISG